jgi:RND superfamily putative drug exporter
MTSLNIAGRAGRWSAAHWKTALFAWLALVAVAVVAGGAAGTKRQTEADSATGETAKAIAILERAGFKDHVGESVLVQSTTVTVGDARFRSAVTDVIARLAANHDVRRVQPPLAPGHEGQISRDRHSALIQFEIGGPHDKAQYKVQPILTAVAAAQKAHPGLYVGEFGMASAMHALDETLI